MTVDQRWHPDELADTLQAERIRKRREKPNLTVVELLPAPKDASEAATVERVIGAICPEGMTAAELAEHAARILNVLLTARKKQARPHRLTS